MYGQLRIQLELAISHIIFKTHKLYNMRERMYRRRRPYVSYL
jgi:hypothetical protein